MIRFAFDGDDEVFTAHGQGEYWIGGCVDHHPRHPDGGDRPDELPRRSRRRLAHRPALGWRQVDLHTDEEEWDLTITPDADGCYLLDMGLTIAVVD